jgi:hypothetical protein
VTEGYSGGGHAIGRRQVPSYSTLSFGSSGAAAERRYRCPKAWGCVRQSWTNLTATDEEVVQVLLESVKGRLADNFAVENLLEQFREEYGYFQASLNWMCS